MNYSLIVLTFLTLSSLVDAAEEWDDSTEDTNDATDPTSTTSQPEPFDFSHFGSLVAIASAPASIASKKTNASELGQAFAGFFERMKVGSNSFMDGLKGILNSSTSLSTQTSSLESDDEKLNEFPSLDILSFLQPRLDEYNAIETEEEAGEEEQDMFSTPPTVLLVKRMIIPQLMRQTSTPTDTEWEEEQ